MATAVEVINTWKYANERVHLSPYDASAFDEAFLPLLYQQTKADGLLDITFPGFRVTLNSFVSFMHSHNVGLVIGTVKPDYKVAGYGWLNEIEGTDGARKASFGFCFLRRFHRTTLIREIARLALQYWFEECKVTILYGATLKRNYAAQKFSREMGFYTVGTAPKFFSRDGKMEDAVIVTLEVRDFLCDLTVLKYKDAEQSCGECWSLDEVYT